MAMGNGKKKPAYMAVYEKIKHDIIRGSYEYGAKLPSKRIAADTFGVSISTIEHAYWMLLEEGYVQSREKSGYFCIYREEDGFMPSDEEAAAPLLQQSFEKPEGFPFSVYAKTMRRVLSERGEQILVKSPNSGCAELRQAICKYLARSRGIDISAEQIVIGSGAEYLYGLIVQLLGRDRTFAIESPSYEKIEQVYRANGVSCRLLPLGKDGIESSALSSCGADVLHITPFRSFPSGVTASAAKKREYLRWAEKNDSVIIEDDFESEFTILSKPEDTVFYLDKNQRVIYVNTFSQTIAPAIRIGYMLLPERLVNDFEEKAGFYSCTVPTYEQYVLAEFISSGNFEKHINRVRRKKRKLHFGESEK